MRLYVPLNLQPSLGDMSYANVKLIHLHCKNQHKILIGSILKLMYLIVEISKEKKNVFIHLIHHS